MPLQARASRGARADGRRRRPCARAVFCAKKEGDPDYGAPRNPDHVDSWGARLRGTIFEHHFWAPALRARLARACCSPATQQETFALGFLSATPDALIVALEATRWRRSALPTSAATAPGRRVQDDRPARQARRAAARAHLPGAGAARPDPRADPAPAGIRADHLHRRLVLGPHLRVPDPARSRRSSQPRSSARSTSCWRAPLAELRPEGWIAGGARVRLCPFTRACGSVRAAVPATTRRADPQLVAEIVDAGARGEAGRSGCRFAPARSCANRSTRSRSACGRTACAASPAMASRSPGRPSRAGLPTTSPEFARPPLQLASISRSSRRPGIQPIVLKSEVVEQTCSTA